MQQQKIVEDCRLDCLVAVSNDLLSKGWQLVGAPFRDERREMWCQSMIGPVVMNGVQVREPKRK